MPLKGGFYAIVLDKLNLILYSVDTRIIYSALANRNGDMKNNSEIEHCVCYCRSMRRATQSITNIYNKSLASSGLSISQFSILVFLYRIDKVSVSELAKAMGLDRTTLVRNLKPLEKQGLVIDVSTGGRDRQLILTEDGQETYKTTSRLWKDVQSEIEQVLGKERLEEFLKTAKEIEALTD
jgi:DNA-binding MarR family transcriptional regulator